MIIKIGDYVEVAPHIEESLTEFKFDLDKVHIKFIEVYFPEAGDCTSPRLIDTDDHDVDDVEITLTDGISEYYYYTSYDNLKIILKEDATDFILSGGFIPVVVVGNGS